MSEQCTNCGTGILEERTIAFVVEHDGHRGEVQDRVMRCSDCGNLSYVGEQISAHEHAVAAEIRHLLGLLTPDQLKGIRGKYSLTQKDMEQMLSIGPKTWIRWERGKVVQSKSVDTLIRSLALDPELARRLVVQAGIQNPEADAVFADFRRRDHARIVEAMEARIKGGDVKDFAAAADDVMRVLWQASHEGGEMAA